MVAPKLVGVSGGGRLARGWSFLLLRTPSDRWRATHGPLLLKMWGMSARWAFYLLI